MKNLEMKNGFRMYSIEKTDYGLKITFTDIIEEYEIKRWLHKSRVLIANMNAPFCVLIDMSDIISISHSARKVIMDAQKEFKAAGMKRSAVLFHDPVTVLQFQKLAKESGIDQWERYFDVSNTEDVEESALQWLLDGEYNSSIKHIA